VINVVNQWKYPTAYNEHFDLEDEKE
jgi:hypothetical protein